MLTPQAFVLLALSFACDVAGQLCFKLGTGVAPDQRSRSRSFAWTSAGLGIFAIETLLWLRVLGVLPLTVALPIASLNMLGVAVASRVFLGECVTPRRWAGTAIVTAGVVLVASSA